MKTNFLYGLRKVIAWTSLIWDNSLSVFCISIIVVILAISNHSILYLLPLSIGFDLLILFFAIYKNYKEAFTEMIKDSLFFENLEKADPEHEAIFQNEISKTWQYAGGNKFGTKRITSFICKDLQGLCTSYSFYSDESIVLLHKDYDDEDDKDLFSWIHEMSHCSWHSMINQKRITTIVHSVFLVIITIFAAIVSHSWWMLIFSIMTCLLILFLENPLYLYSKKEMDADAMALSIFSDLYGKERMRIIARIFTNIYYEELMAAKTAREGKRRINTIFNFFRFTTEEDQRKIINKLNARIAEEVKNNNPASKIQRIKLRALALNFFIRKPHQVESFSEVFLTLNPPLYYIVFPALMCIAFYVLHDTMTMMAIPQWCILLVVVPIVLLLILKKSIENLTIAKSLFVENIRNK